MSSDRTQLGREGVAPARPSRAGPIQLGRIEPFGLGPLRIEAATRQVIRGEWRETLEPRIMQVLVALARAEGDVVTHEELIETCWAGAVVGDGAINRCISRLRKLAALSGAFSIETIARVGYRLRPPRPESESAAGASPTASVCVLPFVNMSGDSEQEYFSDGISEDIITDLGRARALFVVARTTAFTFKGAAVDAREIAQRLNVRYVITGSVRRSGERVRIGAQLIDGATGGQIWADRYDRDLKDIFALQDEVSRAIVGALEVRLLPDEQEAIADHGTTSAEAYDLYLMARQKYVCGDQGAPDWGEAIIRLCRRATELDPGYAAAWAYLAIGYAASGWQSGASADEGMACAERALTLKPGLAAAHTAKARILSDGGRPDDAWREIEIALRLDPHDWLANYTATLILWPQHRDDEAIGHFEAAAALSATDIVSPAFLIACYLRVGNREAIPRAAEMSLAHVKAALAKDKENAHAIATGSVALGFLGRKADAKAWVERALLLDPDNMLVRYIAAECLVVHFSEVDRALDMLDFVLARAQKGYLELLEFSPHFHSIQKQPRFRAILTAAKERLAAKRDTC